MPKIPKEKYGESGLDPESEEYNPSMAEVREEMDVADHIRRELADMGYELGHYERDPYTGGINKFRADAPEFIWDRLVYLDLDYLRKIKDPKLRKNLKDEVSRVEKEIYRQFIPYIDSLVNIFGWQHSPLEKRIPRNKISVSEINTYFSQAREVLGRFEIKDDEKRDFIDELDRLQEKFARYQKEPALFTFEKIEEEIQKAIHDYDLYSRGLREKRPSRIIENKEPKQEDAGELDVLLGKAQSLLEIASLMLDSEIRADCKTRAESLFQHIGFLKKELETDKFSDEGSKKFHYEGVDWAWELLGIGRNALPEEAKKAYRKLSLKHHPDIDKTEGALEKMQRINEAYEFIKRIQDLK